MRRSKEHISGPGRVRTAIIKQHGLLLLAGRLTAAIGVRRPVSENHGDHRRIIVDAGSEKSEPEDTNSLNDLAQRGYAAIPAVRIARFAAHRRTATATATPALAVMSIAIMALWPLLLNTVLYFVWPAQSLRDPNAILLISISAIIVAAMLTAAWGAWSVFAKYAVELDKFLLPSPDRTKILRWFGKRLHTSRQAAVGLLGMGAALLLTFHAKNVSHLDIEVRTCSYIMSALMGFVGANVVYWLYTMAELTLRLARCRELRLDWFDPARTPAIRVLCKGYAFTAPALVIGVVTVELLALLIPSNGDLVLEGLALGFPVFAAITALYVCLQPYVTLYLLAKRFKTMTLARIAVDIRELDSALEDAALATRLEAYRHVASAPNLPVSTTSVVQYAAAIAGSLAAFLLQKYVA